MNNKLSILDGNKKIENMIYEIRGKQVMLDSDLAKLYQCKNGTKSINLAVKRHINRFPERFMFQLTEEETEQFGSRFQVETLNRNNQKQGLNVKYLPYVFTEQGVAMLSSILRTEVAEEVSIAIMDAFVAMKKYISSSLLEQRYINNMVLEHEKEIKLLKNTFSSFQEKTNEIFFDGQVYDAYSKLVDIFKSAKSELIIIDGYADKITLDIIKSLEIDVVLITKENRGLKEIDIKKYKEQYTNLKLIYSNKFHDRYFILDKEIVYHSGTSVNYAGNKTFSLNKLEDEEIINLLISKVENEFKVSN